METSIFIAKILAVTYLAMGLWFLISGDYYKKELIKLLDNACITLMGGLMAIILGALIIQYHSFWVKDWPVIITIIGWIALIKWVLLLVFPHFIHYFKPLLKSENIHKFFTPVCIIVGLIFAYFGFFS